MLATSYVSVINVNDGQDGSPGAQGPQGVSITGTKEQWFLSTSNQITEGTARTITVDGKSIKVGQWTYEEPALIPDGYYLWGRIETTMSEGNPQYSDAVHRSVISGIKSMVDEDHGVIESKVWETYTQNQISSYDNSTVESIREDVSDLTQDLSGITTRVGNAETALATKADGSTVQTLSENFSTFQQTMNGFKTTVEQNYATKTELGNIKVSGNNLYLIKNQVSGYINSSSGAISNPSSTYKEKTSEYIPVTPGKTYIIQAWATPTQTRQSWLAYQFFTDKNASSKIGSRSAKTGSSSGSGVETTADGQERLTYKVQAPETAHYLRVSYRQYTDGYCMVEQATLPSEYAIATADLENETSSVRTIAEQTADKFSWIVEDGSTSSSVTYTSNALTAMANQIDLTGKVTFNSMDSTLKNTLNGVKAFTGTCSTDSGGDGVKIVTCADATFSLTSGVIITVTFSKASTDLIPYLNVNSLGAKRIYFDGDLTRSENRFCWKAGSVITFRYDGSYWVVLDYKNIEYTSSSTAAATATKTNNTTVGTFVLCRGTTINVYFSTANTANAPKLNIDGTGEYPIYYKGAEVNSSNKYLWDAGSTFTFTYNGATRWYMTDCGSKIVKDYAKTAVDWVGSNGSTVVTAADIMKTWTNDATLATTTIDGGYIKTHTIEANHLATDAITSSNYARNTSQVYSTTGTFLDLSNGDIHSPTFAVDNTAGMAYIDGAINARYLYLGMSSADLASSDGTLVSSGGDIAAIAPVLGSYIYYDGETLMINTENFHIGSDGNVSMSGSINSTSGLIGGWIISENDIHYGMEIGQSGTAYLIPAGSTTMHSIGGSSTISGWTITSGSNFGVTNTGALYASDVNISGTVSAYSGSIGSWLINPDYLSYGTIGQANSAFLVPAGTLSAYSIGGSPAISGWVLTAGENFGVTNTGTLYASNANITGKINATTGSIGGFTIRNNETLNDLGFFWETTINNVRYNYWCGLKQKGGSPSVTSGSIRMFEITRQPLPNGSYASQFYVGSDGYLFCQSGTLGGWTLTSTSLKATSNSKTTGLQVPSSGVWAIAVGATNANDWGTAPFRVNHSGAMYSTSGQIGGFNIGTNYIKGYNNTFSIYSNTNSAAITLSAGSNSGSSLSNTHYVCFNGSKSVDISPNGVTISDGTVEVYNVTNGGNLKTITGAGDNGIIITNANDKSGRFIINSSNNFGIFDNDKSDWVLRRNGTKTWLCGNGYAVRMGEGNSSDLITFMPRTMADAVSNGKVNLGAASCRWQKVYTTGGVDTSSDERIKTIHRYLEENHKKLFMALKPIEYSFIDKPDEKHFGLGAQTTEAAMEKYGFGSEYSLVEHAFYDEEDTYGRYDTYNMNYDEVAILTVPVVQEHEKEIERLKARITELENKLHQITQ